VQVKLEYLQPAQGPVIEGLEDHEKIIALEQPEYLPLRTLLGEKGKTAIYRCELTEEQRRMVATGADVLVEIFLVDVPHYGRQLSPSLVMILDQQYIPSRDNFIEWITAQFKLLLRRPS
jgi:hypothetical protein